MIKNKCSCELSQPSPMEEINLISFDEVKELIPMSKSRLYTLMREGKFPRPVKIGEHRAVWIKHEVLAYRAARIAERDAIKLK